MSHQRIRRVVATTAVALIGASAGGAAIASATSGHPSATTAPAAPAAPHGAVKAARATVVDDRFMPTHLTVKKGGTVTWVWKGSSAHNVTITGPARHHSPTQTHGTYRVRFVKAGTYHVVCTIHESEGMKMTVTVVS